METTANPTDTTVTVNPTDPAPTATPPETPIELNAKLVILTGRLHTPTVTKDEARKLRRQIRAIKAKLEAAGSPVPDTATTDRFNAELTNTTNEQGGLNVAVKLVLTDQDQREGWTETLTPTEARKLARKLLRLASEAEEAEDGTN